MGANTDIDIDFPSRDRALAALPHVAASMTLGSGRRQRHPSGIYLQDVPVDPVDQMASLDYREAGDHGYTKLDFLNNHLYARVRDEAHLLALMAREPLWEMLDDPEIVAGLSQVGRHFHIVSAIRPRSIPDLAICLALIRPAAQRLEMHRRPRAEIEARVWGLQSEGGGYSYKKSHATAFAASIVVQMNLLVEDATDAMPAT